MKLSKIKFQALSVGLLAAVAFAEEPAPRVPQGPTAAAREGTNIGNGSLDVNVTVNGSPGKVNVKVSTAATGVSRQGLRQWCTNKLGVLNDIREEAAMAKVDGKPREDVIAIYDGGFERLSEGFGEFKGGYSLTQRAIVRGKEISEALGETLVSEEKSLTTRVHFLESYYNFIERVAREVDIPYYIPYYNRGGCKDGCDIEISEESFAIKLLENARDQLSMVLSKMASVGPNGEVFPQGVPGGYLTALEFATKNAALDLEETLLYTRMACVIGDLHALGDKLARYNTGNGAEYGGRDDRAVRMSYSRAETALTEIRSAIATFASYNCGGRAPERHVRHNREPRAYPLPPFVTPEGVSRRD
jgi:hypothetical protein